MTVLKTTFSKNKPREIVHRNYKYFNSQNFNDEVKFIFSRENIDSCSRLNQTFLDVLNKHAPLKKKRLRANHASYVFKSMQKPIMKRSYVENVYCKKKNGQVFKSVQKTEKLLQQVLQKET